MSIEDINRGMNVEVEGEELLLQSEEGHYAVIPKDKRDSAMQMIEAQDDDGLNRLISSLPKVDGYSDDGSLNMKGKKGSKERMSEGHTEKTISDLHGVSTELIRRQVKLGIQVEYEHTTSEIEAKRTALDHLVEIPDYYTRLLAMETDAKKELGMSEEEEEKKSGNRLSTGFNLERIANHHKVSPTKIKQQIEKGIDIEYEHTSDEEEARRIALDHLVELPDYYDRLINMLNTSNDSLKAEEGMLVENDSYIEGDAETFEQWRTRIGKLNENFLNDDPFYNIRGAYESGMEPQLYEDGEYHLGSRNPKTGEILKREGHPTWDLMVKGEEEAGYELYQEGGTWYSKKKVKPEVNENQDLTPTDVEKYKKEWLERNPSNEQALVDKMKKNLETRYTSERVATMINKQLERYREQRSRAQEHYVVSKQNQEKK